MDASDLVSLMLDDLDEDVVLSARDLFLRPHPQLPGLTGDSASSLSRIQSI